MMTTDEATDKFNEIVGELTTYVAISSTMKHGYIVANAHIDMRYKGKRLAASLAIDKIADSMTIIYASPDYAVTHTGGRYRDNRWKRKLYVDNEECPIIKVFTNAVILNIIYDISVTTTVSRELEKLPKNPPQLLIYNLWNYISTRYDFDRAIIYTNKQECITISLKYGKYECVLDDCPINSIRDIRDLLDDATIKIYYIGGSTEYGYVNDLCPTTILNAINNFAVIIDDAVVMWSNCKWYDEEYLESHK